MELETYIPSHCALAFLGNTLEHFHGELTFVVYNRYTGAVHKTNPGAFAEACKFEEHGESHETTWHHFDKTVV